MQEHDQDVLLARVLQEQERAFHSMYMEATKTPVKERPLQQLPAEALSDEDFARQLQEQEDEEAYGAGGEYGYESEAELDYDRLSYEAYTALGDVAGAVSKGLSVEVLQQLPRMSAAQHLAQQCSCKAIPQAATGSTAAAAAPAGADAAHLPRDCSCVASTSICVVCQCKFEGEEVLKLLPSCGHAYHEECIDQWLAGSKDCPICHKEVTTMADSAATKAA